MREACRARPGPGSVGLHGLVHRVSHLGHPGVPEHTPAAAPQAAIRR